MLHPERGPGWTHDYLRWRSSFYPAPIAEVFRALAGAEPDADEIALARLRLPL
jgi:ABC-type enterobactin transport system permease subunit